METKYFFVEVRCGHVGKNYYILKTLALKAENAKEAAEIARYTPRVKHDMKYAIEEVKEVSEDEFYELLEINNNDAYFKCGSIQEQRMFTNSELDRIRIKDYDDYDKLENKRVKEFKRKRDIERMSL